ncbi:unnamed protein product [Prorocentrum cordatum]|uniref:Uncharacterized protein n=1 Tax=Prorocentrum cordatum TaxID=2364126 RepID=A0ABN9UPI1_9DINO|nr:unnamed protein product [Polarella glacialis]
MIADRICSFGSWGPAALFAALVLVSGCWSDSAEEEDPEHVKRSVTDKFCCFDDTNDASAIPVGTGWVLTADYALCPSALADLRFVVGESYRQGVWGHLSGFPALGLPANVAFPACRNLPFAGPADDDEIRGITIPESLWRGREETLTALCNGALAACAAKVMEAVESTSGPWKDLHGFALEAREVKTHNILFSNTYYLHGAQHPIHVDFAQFNINVHLNAGLEGTGTAFWHSSDGKCQELVQDTSNLSQFCAKKVLRLPDGESRGIHGNYSRSVTWIQKKKGRHLEVAGLIDREDLTGNFNLTQLVSYKQNRLVIYSGHLFHSHSVRPEEMERLTEDPRKGRLMLMQFRASPLLKASLKAAGIPVPDTEEDGPEEAAQPEEL